MAIEIAISGVPGPVHVAIPIDIQHENIESVEIPPLPKRLPIVPDLGTIKETARELVKGIRVIFLQDRE